MPEQLAEWGCDATLWDSLPLGARRDLERFANSGSEDLARCRILTMKEVVQYNAEPGAVWEQAAWDKSVLGWEQNRAELAAAELARVKAEKKAAAKAKREATAAKEEEQKHGL
eukprot:CAMPEP_0194378480 /NCGR_PEP_ID=MMETSP0174-20130528/35495_1 /TAXON_ID=216777 /ORGANISM="Proboscia alata, Strain PI-D3" /LENGTH=112 /DNA_ID=CAMNT_0039160521 /DNA_START=160 /DNA_END=498 /DNA_ORIENTATION=-